MVRSLPAMQETRVGSLGQEDPLEKGKAAPVFLSGGSHGQRSLAGYSSWGYKELNTAEHTHVHSLSVTRDFQIPV